MAIYVDMDMSGVARLVERLEGIQSDLSDPIEEAMLEVLDIVRERFEKEDDGTRRWKNLSPRRIKERGSAHPILRDTGAMFASLTTRGAPGNEFTVDRMLGVVGSSDKKARWHQLGRGHNPRRAFLTLTRAEKADLAGIFFDHIDAELHAGGGR
jgi:phage gpG-like protein